MRVLKRIVFIILVLVSNLLSAQNLKFQPMTIDEMFVLADANSKSIRSYCIADEEAKQAIAVAKNAQLPSIDVSVSASYLGDGHIWDRNFANGTSAPMPHFGNNFALEATQVIYAGGVISNGIAIAQLQQQIAQLDKENNRQDIRFLLVANYLELFKLHNQEKVYKNNIEQTKKLVSDIEAKECQGLALKNDVTRYELQLKSLELALVQIQNSITIINNQLITVLGLPLDVMIEVDSTILNVLPVVDAESEWQIAALHESQILKQAKLGIEITQKNEKIVKSDRLPSIVVFAADHLDGPITIEVPPMDNNFNYWYIGLGVKFNIASIYKSKRTEKLASLSTEQAIEKERLLQEHVQTNVKASYVRYIEAFTIYDTQLKSLVLATQNYEVVNNRYLNDLALITDMLDAGNSKLSAELQVANAQVNILFNYFKLKRAVGNIL